MSKRYLGGGVSFEQKDVYQEFTEDDTPSPGGSSTLAGLSDVDISNPTDGQTLVYDATNQKWVNGSGSGGGSGVLVCNLNFETYAVDHTWEEIKNAPIAVIKIDMSEMDPGSGTVSMVACQFNLGGTEEEPTYNILCTQPFTFPKYGTNYISVEGCELVADAPDGYPVLANQINGVSRFANLEDVDLYLPIGEGDTLEYSTGRAAWTNISPGGGNT